MKAPIVTIALLAGGYGLAAGAVEPVGSDFRISFQQGTGDPTFGGRRAAVAFNPAAREYLVVWEGDFQAPFPVCPIGSPQEQEIFAQRVAAASGALLGPPVQVSQSGPDCNGQHQASMPALAYNADDGEYLVVWQADDDSGGLADNELEIYGRRLDAGGNLLGADQFRISAMGGTGDPAFDATQAAIVWNPIHNQYLVVWIGDDDEGLLADNEFEVYGQLLNAAGAEIGDDDFRISVMGIDSRPEFTAAAPAVSTTGPQYLVVWEGSDSGPGAGELEIFGQRIRFDGDQLGFQDFRISFQQGTGDASFRAKTPSLAYNPRSHEYLVVWQGDFRRAPAECAQAPPIEQEIFAQRLEATGATPVGAAFRISQSGPICDATHKAQAPVAAFDAGGGDYLVAWFGDDDRNGLVNDEFEIFAREISRGGALLGAERVRISEMGGTGNQAFDGVLPDLADDQPLVVWHGDDDTGGLVNNELEVFGQRLVDRLFADGFE